jgi:hypothetical protein
MRFHPAPARPYPPFGHLSPWDGRKGIQNISYFSPPIPWGRLASGQRGREREYKIFHTPLLPFMGEMASGQRGREREYKIFNTPLLPFMGEMARGQRGR